MAIDFPAAPALDQEYTDTNGTVWICTNATGPIWARKSTLAVSGDTVSYNNTGSSLSATDVNSAIDELDSNKANLDSPALTGNPTAPTPLIGDNDTSIANAEFVQSEIVSHAQIGKNLIVNGDFSVWQRGTSASITSTAFGYNSVDRWQFYYADTAITKTVQLYNGSRINSMQIAHSGTQRVYTNQFIENGASVLSGRDVTVSFVATVTSGITAYRVRLALYDDIGFVLYEDTSDITLTGISAKYEVTFNVTDISAQNIASGKARLNISGVTAGASTLLISNVQLEVGSQATEFEHIPYQAQLNRCGVPDDSSEFGYKPIYEAVIDSPTFTGNPTAPTPSAGDNDTSIATTAFVQGERSFPLQPISKLVKGTLDISNTTNELVQTSTTYTGTGDTQSIPTGIGSTDINYVAGGSYSQGDVRFFRDNFKLIEATGTPSEGGELVTNGTFDSTTTGWTADSISGNYDGTLSVVSNKLRVTNSASGADYGLAIQTISGLTIGNVYVFSVDVTLGTSALGLVRIGTSLHNLEYAQAVGGVSASGNYTFAFTATSTDLYITLGNGANTVSQYTDFDNISVKELVNWTEVPDDEVHYHDNSRVWIKARTGLTATRQGYNYVYDTLRGVAKSIHTNNTDAEFAGDGGSLKGFDSNGFTLWSSGFTDVNVDSQGYVAWQIKFNKVFITTTNQSKRALVAFDDVSKRSMVLYQGSGTAGHEIPHGLGQTPRISISKTLTAIGNWWAAIFNADGSGFGYNVLNGDSPASLNDSFGKLGNSTTYTTSRNDLTNASSQVHIAYCEANSDVINIGTYSGTGAAGNEIHTGFKPSYFMWKRLDTTSSWGIHDNTRADPSNVLYADLTAIEDTYSAYLDFISDGIEFEDGLTMNALGGEYLYIAYADTKANSGGSYTDQPSETSNLQLTDGVIGFSNGYDKNGALNSTEEFAGTNTLTPTFTNNALNYVYRNKDTSWGATPTPPVKTGSVDGFADWYWKGKWWDKFNLVTNGDFSNGTTGWIAVNSSLSTIDGKLKITNVGANYGTAKLTITTVAGIRYLVKVSHEQGSSIAAYLAIGSAEGTSNLLGAIITNQEYVGLFTATTTLSYFAVYNVNDLDKDGFYSNISVVPYIQDESDYTAKSTPITYLPKAVRVDVDGNVAELVDYIHPDITVDALAVKDLIWRDRPIYSGYMLNNLTTQDTIIPLETVIDNYNAMNGGIWTCPKKGMYKIWARNMVSHTILTSAETGSHIRINDEQVMTLVTYNGVSASDNQQTMSGKVVASLDIGDTVYLYAEHADTNHYILGNSTFKRTAMTIEFLGDF